MRVPAYSNESASTGTSSSASRGPSSLPSSTPMRSTNSRTQGTNGTFGAGADWGEASASKVSPSLDQTPVHLSIPHLFRVDHAYLLLHPGPRAKSLVCAQ